MSQTKQWSVNLGTTVRQHKDTGARKGAGGSQRLYVGRDGNFDYDSFIRFALDWTGVGQIVSAVLSLYTDNGLGEFDSTTTETPTVKLRRLIGSFSEHTNSASFVDDDDTNPANTSSAQKTKVMSRATFGLTQVDITSFAEDWAPATVKKRDGTAGGKKTNYGIGLYGDTDTKHNWAGWSEDYTDPTYRPFVTLTYEYGVTVPDTPTNLTPSGAVASLDVFEGDFNDIKPTDRLQSSEVEVYTSPATNAGQTVTGGTRLYTAPRTASEAERVAAHFTHLPDDLHLVVNTTYKWRCRVKDQEGQYSLWTNLVSFSVTNTDPDAPVLSPASGYSTSTMDGTPFEGTFVDSDVGDYLIAYQVQLSAYPSGDAHWLDDEFILWNTGKRYVNTVDAQLDAAFSTPYGGAALDAGTYYWRARVWDNHHGVSSWAYASIVITDDFAPEPDGTQTAIQIRPRAPWRIVIKDMLQTDFATRMAGRAPGNVVAILENAKAVGASKVYNSPGELHFTLPIDHPQISALEPRQTHYSVQFRQGDGWREAYAGLMMDFDATDTDVVFYGTDYLGLLLTQYDERYDASNPDKPNTSGGSKYVNKTLGYIVRDQLSRAITQSNSPLGFITINQNLATYEALMPETVTIFSTYANVMDLVVGLIDSHRAGTGKLTQLSVRQKTGGGYEFYLEDDPGTQRDELRLRYGELAQGFRVIPFGKDWSSSVAGIGRAKDGVRVMYSSAAAPGIDEAVWGHFVTAQVFDGVSDENDLKRRIKQAAVHGGKLGKSVAIGLRHGVLAPFDGFTLTDQFPVDIEYGPVSTDAFGSGYWVAVAVTWTVDAKTAAQSTTLSLTPRDDATAPDSDLLTTIPISTQAEWQLGWEPPDVFGATARHYLDQATGLRYDLQDDGTYLQEDNDPRNNNLLVNSGFEVIPIATVLTKTWDADWTGGSNKVNMTDSTGTLTMTDATY